MAPRLIVSLILAAFLGPGLAEAQGSISLADLEAPSTALGADVFPGRVAVRDAVDRYVVSVDGEWGTATLLIRTEGAVQPLAAMDPRGSVILREKEVAVTLPKSDQALRLALPGAPNDEVSLQVGRLHGLRGSGSLLQARALSIIGYAPAIDGLEVDALLAASEDTISAAFAVPEGFDKVLEPVDPAIRALIGNDFDQTPPDDPGSSCTRTCSVSCRGGNACTATGGSSTSCCKCRCSGSIALCYCSG